MKALTSPGLPDMNRYWLSGTGRSWKRPLGVWIEVPFVSSGSLAEAKPGRVLSYFRVLPAAGVRLNGDTPIPGGGPPPWSIFAEGPVGAGRESSGPDHRPDQQRSHSPDQPGFYRAYRVSGPSIPYPKVSDDAGREAVEGQPGDRPPARSGRRSGKSKPKEF